MYKAAVLTKQNAAQAEKSFSHGQDITKEVLATKVKSARAKYHEAVDTGRRSGHSRVVTLPFEFCQMI